MTSSIPYALLGARNSGKTTYLTLLYAQEPSISANNPQTVFYLKDEVSFLEKRRPHPTRMTLQNLLFLYHNHTIKLAFSIQDYDGYFAESLSMPADDNPDKERLKQSVKQAQGLLFLFPYESDFHPQALDNFRHEINTYIHIVNDLYPEHASLPTPVVIAVTKWDRSPYFGAANEHDHAVAYLDSIPLFHHAKKQIERFFASVKVIPTACFRPNSCELAPYNLTEAFDFFIDTATETWLNRLQSVKNNPPALYRLLYEIDASPYRSRLATALPLESLLAETETAYYHYLIDLLRQDPTREIETRHAPFSSSSTKSAPQSQTRNPFAVNAKENAGL